MTRRDKNFKLSKESKRLLACYVDPHKRGLFKNSMIFDKKPFFLSQIFVINVLVGQIFV